MTTRTTKPVDLLVRMLVDGVSKNGNLLLNVGPTARGNFDPAGQVRALQGISDWMDLHARSIYGATMSPFTPPADVRYTQRGNRLYVHIFSWPFEHLHLPDSRWEGLSTRNLLNDASEIRFRCHRSRLSRAATTGVGGQPPAPSPSPCRFVDRGRGAGCRALLVRAGSVMTTQFAADVERDDRPPPIPSDRCGRGSDSP